MFGDEPFGADSEIDGELVTVVIFLVFSFCGIEAVGGSSGGGETDDGGEIDVGGEDDGDKRADGEVPIDNGRIDFFCGVVDGDFDFGIVGCHAEDELHGKIFVDGVDDGDAAFLAGELAHGGVDADAQAPGHVFGGSV